MRSRTPAPSRRQQKPTRTGQPGSLASGVHRIEEFGVALGVAQLVQQEVNRIHGSHRVKNTPQDVNFLEHRRMVEKFLFAGSGAGDVHRREGTFVPNEELLPDPAVLKKMYVL